MLKLKEINQAVKIVNQSKLQPSDANQIIMSLMVYKDRGEFDGSMYSAFECLELAGYEIEGRK